MTQHDLIVGHFEGTLSKSQEAELQTLLQSSSDARTAYQNHSAMQDTLEEDSRRMIPPVGLREATIGAALGTAVQTISGGIGAWLSTKVAMVIGTLVAGGIITGVVLYNDNEAANQSHVTDTEESVSADDTQAPVGSQPVQFDEESGPVGGDALNNESEGSNQRNARAAAQSVSSDNSSSGGTNDRGMQSESSESTRGNSLDFGKEQPTPMNDTGDVIVHPDRQ